LNSVRVPFNAKLFLPEEYDSLWTNEGFTYLDSVVTWCKRAHLWVVLDMHCAPGGQTGDNIDDSWGYPPLLLRGINIGNWLVPEGYMFKLDSATSPRLINNLFTELLGPDEARRFWRQFRNNYLTFEDIRFIKAVGLNSVRVPFSAKLFLPEEYDSLWTNEGFTYLDSVVTWCKRAHLWVVLDMHCAPGGQTGDNIDDSWGYPFLFEHARSQENTIGIWRRIAERYADEPAVLGYDLLNEPIAPYFDTAALNARLEPLYKRIVAAIRSVDRDHLVFLGGAQWNSNFSVFGTPFDSAAVYTFHRYWCDTTAGSCSGIRGFSGPPS